MARPSATVLYHLPDNYLPLDPLKERFPEVAFIEVPTSGPIPDEVSGEILLTLAAPSNNLLELLRRGVRWVHCTGHGGDPFRVLGGQVVQLGPVLVQVVQFPASSLG